jgi:glycosyltransferase involved in cell wall biosynthesis
MRDRIKVLHVGFGGRGGAARVLLDIAKNHSPQFMPSVILLGYDVDSGYIEELKENGIASFSILKHRRVDLNFLHGLKKMISEINPDVALFHTPVAYLWGRLPFIIDRRNKKIISVEHLASTGYGFFTALWNLSLSLRTDKIICVSQAVKSYLEKKGFPSQKLVVIENGITIKPLSDRNLMVNDPLKVTMVARLAPPKDHKTLLKAFKIIAGKGYPVILNIVGNGPLRESLIQMSKDLGISNKLIFMGERQDVRSILLDTDLFVLSTHNEGLPIALLEAMEAGCPVIATDIPTVSQVIQNGLTGILVPEEDETSLSTVIIKLIDNPEMAIKIAKNGRELVEKRYNIVNTVRGYETIFTELLSSNHS